MALTFADLVIVAALVAAGCGVVYVSLQRALRRTAHELHQSTEDRLGKLTSAISAVEKQIAQPSLAPVVLPAATGVVPTTKTEAQAPVSKETVHSPKEKTEEVTPEILVVIAAAVTAFLGKKVRIRSAKMLQSPYEIVNPWSQQGRVFVQASHNLRSRS